MLLPDNINSTGSDFGVLAGDGHGGSEGTVDAEHDTLRLRRNHCQREVYSRMVTPATVTFWLTAGDRLGANLQILM